MARAFYINGESMVSVKGPAGSAISSLTQLGLAAGPVRVSFELRHKPMHVDAYGEAEVDLQYMATAAHVHMDLIHYDTTILDLCFLLAQGNGLIGNLSGPVVTIGQANRAGQTLGNNSARFAASNSYVGLNILSPVEGKPYRFYYAYMFQAPMTVPLGTEKSVTSVHWRCIPYTNDPWGGGTAQPNSAASFGLQGALIWDNTLDV